jgi:hypothetical protein
MTLSKKISTMKTIQAVLTTIMLCLLSVTATAQTKPKSSASLSNTDVIEMVKAGFSNEIIIAKVINSPAAFDTASTALKELKAANVPDEIILAIVRNPLGSNSPNQQKTSVVIDETAAAEYGTIADVKDLRKAFVKADDEDIRTTIVQRLNCSQTVGAVDSPKDADYFIEYTTLTRDVAPGRHGASMALKSQMRVVVVKPNGSRVIAWTETETFDVSGGFVLGAPNEINLTRHFVNAVRKARGEKTLSLPAFFKCKKED